MFHLCFLEKIVMALKTKGFAGPHQQGFVRRGVRIVAGDALAGFGGRMFEFNLRQKVVMAIKAQRFASELDQELVSRSMRIVAGKTFTILNREMLCEGFG